MQGAKTSNNVTYAWIMFLVFMHGWKIYFKIHSHRLQNLQEILKYFNINPVNFGDNVSYSQTKLKLSMETSSNDVHPNL